MISGLLDRTPPRWRRQSSLISSLHHFACYQWTGGFDCWQRQSTITEKAFPALQLLSMVPATGSYQFDWILRIHDWPVPLRHLQDKRNWKLWLVYHVFAWMYLSYCYSLRLRCRYHNKRWKMFVNLISIQIWWHWKYETLKAAVGVINGYGS